MYANPAVQTTIELNNSGVVGLIFVMIVLIGVITWLVLEFHSSRDENMRRIDRLYREIIEAKDETIGNLESGYYGHRQLLEGLSDAIDRLLSERQNQQADEEYEGDTGQDSGMETTGGSSNSEEPKHL